MSASAVAGTGRQLWPWLGELARVPSGIVGAYLPGSAGVAGRTREQLALVVADRCGSRVTVWIHRSWLEFLGRRDLDDALAPLVDYAAACAAEGRPLDATTLRAVYPDAVVRSVRATVALVGLTVVGDEARSQLLGRLRRPLPPRPLADLGALAATAVTSPVVLAGTAAAAAMRVGLGVAPSMPEPELPEGDEANLVAHLLAEAAPALLAHALIRTAVLWSPVTLAVAARMEGASATLRLGRGRVVVRNGVQPDALLVVEGALEPLVQLVSGSVGRRLADAAQGDPEPPELS
ncbi:MAG: hypothetical protein MUF83_02430 [Acidimicrobiales bacterium]|jgi:hypothetical protein|nr:hypothetical protein [Acidimicrobiales bacterium]